MAILHGSWCVDPMQAQTQSQIGHNFFIWGETWRRIDSPPATPGENHPYALTADELIAFLRRLHQTQQIHWPLAQLTEGFAALLEEPKRTRKTTATLEKPIAGERWQPQTYWQPTYELRSGELKAGWLPQLSATAAIEPPSDRVSLQPWRVEGFFLRPIEAIALLNALPLSSVTEGEPFLGSDLRFWSHIARWHLDLQARSKFLPMLKDGETVATTWQALIDSADDQARLEQFARQMPPACRTYAESADEFVTARSLLLDCLNCFTDAQVKAVAATVPVPSAKFPKEIALREWLQSLSTDAVAVEAGKLDRLRTSWTTWTTPIQAQLNQQIALFRTCFYLQPPAADNQNWTLEYFLQATHDSNFLVSARTIWQNPVDRFTYMGRSIEHPQETLLAGLGLASRLYPVIEPSLQVSQPHSCSLKPNLVYDFIKTIAWRLKDSGFGVVLPPGLSPEQGWASRLGLSVRAEPPSGKQRLGLQSLLNFRWELTIGGQRLSKSEFDRLVAQNTPLVQVNGEWVELRSQDVRAAQAFFTSRKDQLSLSLEDALRMSTGDTQTIEKLPVVHFEASGSLQELIQTLTTGNQSVEEISVPQTFQGQLRPYQLRGASWLAFLERWGLGACLADDMGLGKCVAPDTEIFVNGDLQTAAAIWQNYRSIEQFDGEGYWSTPTESLLVNAIDQTGKIVLAPIRRLYRQSVCEKLRVITLEDGNQITITDRHKLLTDRGWTTNLQPGDYVCVPSRLMWQGQPEDADLVKFLAWQIAEGYELSDRATVNIAQKDISCLEDLQQTIDRIAQRYSLKLNHPAIRQSREKVPALSITSRAYEQFLTTKGYQWGSRSRHKSIPPFIMQADLDSIRLFLRHYFEAEGSAVRAMRSVEISSASPRLMQQLATLLRRFGIWLRVVVKQKRATNGSGIFRHFSIGTIGGNSVRRFLQEIGFVSDRKQQILEEICQTVSNTNVEGIPASELVGNLVHSTKLPIRHFGMNNTVYLNGSQQFSRSSLAQVVTSCDAILSGKAEQQYRQLPPSRWTNQTLQAYTNLDVCRVSRTRQQMQNLLDQEVFYCRIESIESQDYEGWVYDFEVAEHHNFVANQILCHNTVQLITLLLHLQEQSALEQPILLVCPTSVLGNWEREVKRFAPSLKVLVHHGDKRNQGKAFAKAAKAHHLIVTSYALTYRDSKDFESVDWQGVVLDEAQNIKNSESKQSQAVRQLQPQFRIALTGTPVENRLSELWSILDFLNPGYLGPRNFFQRRFAIPIERYGDTASLQTLRSLVQPFILRRLKTDRSIIQDLPDKQEMSVFCGLSTEQAALYQAAVDHSLRDIESADGIQRHGMILALLVKLKQICNHPALNREAAIDSDFAKQSGKLQRLTEMLEELLAEGDTAPGALRDRALIFTQFAEWGKLLKPYLEKQFGREVLFLYGGTSKKQREEMVDRFQNDPQGPRIFILSLKAGGVGLNLTRANHVFHFDRWWNPAVENQATDRVFRIGQTRNVQVHKFVCTGTLEERIHELIESKKALSEQIVGTGESWLTDFDTEQLRDLLLLDRTAVIDD